MSASLLFSSMPKQPLSGGIPLFSQFVGGVVLSGDAGIKLLCAYGGDGGSRSKVCRTTGFGCVPGCSESGKTGWCDPHAQIASTGWCNGAAWHPQDVGTLVAAYSNVGVGINELILDSGTWETALPATVEAVFYPKSCAYPREQRALECQGAARKTHREFLHKYDLTAEQVPLLVLDVGNWEEPFDVPFEHE
jgi:hypothetical protein